MKKLALALPLLLAAPYVLAQKPDDKKPAAAPAAPAAAKPAAPAAGAHAAAAPAAGAPAAGAPPAAAAPPTPKPAPELDQLKFLVGKWKCDGKQFATPMGPEHAIKGSADAKMDLNNFWQVWTYEEKKTKEHMGNKVKGMWGWDGAQKKFVRAGADDHGGWDSATAPGFEGDKIVWTGDFTGSMGRMPFHHTFTKKSDKEWTHLLEVKMPDGKFAPIEEVTCKK
jgi:hypothetical protein